MKSDEIFIWEHEVRINETDFQGIVNNANYLTYMSHARHKHLQKLGISFNKMRDDGFDMVLIHSEIDFKDSLINEDEFLVTSKLELFGRIRLMFTQQVIRKSDQKVMVDAKNILVCISIDSKKPILPKQLQDILQIT